MEKIIKSVILLTVTGILLFAPIFYQHIDGQKINYSLYENVQTDIAEHQFLLPSWE